MAAMTGDVYTSDSRHAFRNFAYLARFNRIAQNNSAADYWTVQAIKAFATR